MNCEKIFPKFKSARFKPLPIGFTVNGLINSLLSSKDGKNLPYDALADNRSCVAERKKLFRSISARRCCLWVLQVLCLITLHS